MESPQNAPRPRRAGPQAPPAPSSSPPSALRPPQPLPPSNAEPPAKAPRLLVAQRLGLVASGLTLVLATVANSPLGGFLRGDFGHNLALYWLLLAANAGSVVCAIGLALGRPIPAWLGAGVFLAMGFLLPQFWFAVLPALLLLGCVLAWEVTRPRPPPEPVPQWTQAPYPTYPPYPEQGWPAAGPWQ